VTVCLVYVSRALSTEKRVFVGKVGTGEPRGSAIDCKGSPKKNDEEKKA
jgi:hypothetical protein